jgi:uncharacterized sulfatase
VLAGIDLPPSLLAVCGVSTPQGVRFDGTDMSAALRGASAEPRKTALMWVRPPDRAGPPNRQLPDLAVRDGDLKLLVDRDGSNAELYDIASDPDEQHNLAAERPGVARRMSDAVIAWEKSIDPRATTGSASPAER